MTATPSFPANLDFPKFLIGGNPVSKPSSNSIVKLVSPLLGDSTSLQIDRVSIVAMANASQADGLEAIIAKHGHKFDAVVANEMGVLNGKAESMRRRLADLEASISAGEAGTARLEPFVPSSDKTDLPPITRSVWASTLAMQAFAALLLAGDMFVCANVLIESGLSNFAEQPAKAYAYSASSMLLAMALKVMLGFFPAGRAKRWLLIALSFVAASGAVWWALLFAEAFPGLGQSTSAILGSLSSVSAGVPVETSHRLVLLQIISGALAGVTLWALAEQIRERYHSQCLVPNKGHAEAMKWLETLRLEHSRVACELGQIDGLLSQFAARRKAFLADAAELFKLTAAACR